ncbi:BTB/POZ domain-containing protein KCTD21-like, partial [Stylophora pistillata]
MNEKSIEEGSSLNNQVFKDAENQIKEVCEVLQREATRLRQEQEAIDAMSKKIDHVHLSSTINLNVGGRRFTTSLQTLTKDPDSMLAAMFSGKFEVKPSEDGAFFIDRDGEHFRFILNYLRDGELIIPEDAKFLKELEAEAKFYQIQGLLEELKYKGLKCFEESVILTNVRHRSTLNGWLPQPGKWQLLFRGFRDGFTAQAFHSKCDNKGPTVTIVRSG